MFSVDSVDWHAELVRGMTTHGVPGAVLLVSDGQRTVSVAAGVTNVNTGVPVTTETLFQIASVTKLWTATLVQLLCEEGLLHLDDLASQHLPELAQAARRVPGFDQITIKQLLTHTSGLQGDMILDHGRGDDVLQRVVEAVCEEPLLFLPGQWMSYSNAAFSVIGRVLEVVSGQTFDDLLQTRICARLGLTRTETLAENVLLHSAAVGHTHAPGRPAHATSTWQPPRSVGPAGLITTTAADLHTFLLMHLRDGQDAQGRQILSADRTIAMRTPQALAPPHVAQTPGEAFGIGWKISPLRDTLRIGHDGSTIGQASFCDTFPDRGGVFILLTNGGVAGELARDLQTLAYPLIAGVEPLPPDAPTSTLIDPEIDLPAPGHYVRSGISIEIIHRDGTWSMIRRDTGLPEITGESGGNLRTGPGGSLWLKAAHGHAWNMFLPATLPDSSRGIQSDGRYFVHQTTSLPSPTSSTDIHDTGESHEST